MYQEVKNSWSRFVKGDIEAFGDVYEKYFPVLTLYCIGILHDEQTAESCATEALVKTMNHKNPGDINDPEKWLFIVAKNQCISELRKIKRFDSQEPAEFDKVVQKDDSLSNDEIGSIITSTLTGEEQKIWQFHSDGYSNEEIAQNLNSTSKTIANKKSGIRSRLKNAFEKHLNLGKKNV